MKRKTSDAVIDVTTPDGTAELEAHVQCRLAGQLHNFRVFVRADGLVLQGSAQTYYAKQQAEDAVREATGFPILANAIEVS
jgi:hypothetical protein